MSASGPAPRRGRIRPRENEPPPLWFGLVFALIGAGILALGAGIGGLPVVAIGLLFGSSGVALTLTTVRAERGRQPFRAARQIGLVDSFTRSPMRILMDLVLAPVGGIAFLGVSIALVALGPMGWIGTVMFGFFGILMLQGAAVTMRRGVRRAVAEVGPDGIWTPELPRRLAWAEIGRLEVEDARGSSGGSAGTAVYRRLGIWPRDASLANRAPGRAAIGMTRAFTSLVNSRAPGGGLSDPSQMAPFGIQAFEIEQDFAEVLRSVRRYAEVAGVPVGAEEPVEPRIVPPTPPPGGLLGAVLGGVSGGPAIAGPAPGSPVEDGTAPGSDEQGPRTFQRRPGAGSAAKSLGEASGPLFMVVFPILFFGLSLAGGMDPLALPPIVWAIFLIPLGFFVYGIASLLELPGRWRMVRGDPALVTVDERGMEMRGMGRLAWSQISEARVVTSLTSVAEGDSPRRLEIVPRDPARLALRPWADRAYDRFRALTGRLTPFGTRRARPAAFGLDLDLLADPEGLLDAIALYRLVDES